MLTVFHVSDLHFGRPTVPEQIEAIESIIQERRFDVVAISGDLSQRAHSGEFQRAQAFIRDANKVSRTIVVPGNHDVLWWKAPLGFGDEIGRTRTIAATSPRISSRCCACPARRSSASTPRTASRVTR